MSTYLADRTTKPLLLGVVLLGFTVATLKWPNIGPYTVLPMIGCLHQLANAAQKVWGK